MTKASTRANGHVLAIVGLIAVLSGLLLLAATLQIINVKAPPSQDGDAPAPSVADPGVALEAHPGGKLFDGTEGVGDHPSVAEPGDGAVDAAPTEDEIIQQQQQHQQQPEGSVAQPINEGGAEPSEEGPAGEPGDAVVTLDDPVNAEERPAASEEPGKEDSGGESSKPDGEGAMASKDPGEGNPEGDSSGAMAAEAGGTATAGKKLRSHECSGFGCSWRRPPP